MSGLLMHGTARYRWPIVLGASLAVHAVVLSIPLAQHVTGDATSAQAPLRVTLAPAQDRAALPKKAATTHGVAHPRRDVPSPHTAPVQPVAATDTVEQNLPSTSLVPDAEASTTASAADFEALPSASVTSTAIATVTDAPPAQPNTGIVLARIRDTIARESYPVLARQRGWEGKVQLGFRVEGSGAIDHVRVMHSSGNRLLDESAMRALQRIRYIPAELWLEGYSAELQMPVIYRLSES